MVTAPAMSSLPARPPAALLIAATLSGATASALPS